MIDQENIARALHPAGRGDRPLHRKHCGVEHLGVRHPRHLHVAQLAQGPAGVVVNILLRIVRRPVLVIEQRIGDAAIRLIHAQNVTSRREGARFRLGLRLWLVIATLFGGVGTALGRRLLGRHHRRELRAGAGNFAALFLQHAQQVRLRAGTRLVRRKDVGGRSLRARLLDGAFGLQIEVAQE